MARHRGRRGQGDAGAGRDLAPGLISILALLIQEEGEDGEKLFTAEDRLDLMGEETRIVSHIAEQMFSEIVSVEEAEKN